MRDSSTHLFSTRLFLIALAFGAAALLVIVRFRGRILSPIPVKSS
jgi:hypothetical protein